MVKLQFEGLSIVKIQDGGYYPFINEISVQLILKSPSPLIDTSPRSLFNSIDVLSHIYV